MPLSYSFVSIYIERIGDYITNIAEGLVVRDWRNQRFKLNLME